MPGAAVEHDRPGLGDSERAGRHDAVRPVEGVVVEWGCVFYLIYGGQPAGGDAIGRDDVVSLALFERGLDGRVELCFRGLDRARVVVGEALEEFLEPVLRRVSVLAGDVGWWLFARLRLGRAPGSLRALSFGALVHHSRKDWDGGSGRSRVRVHRDRGGGAPCLNARRRGASLRAAVHRFRPLIAWAAAWNVASCSLWRSAFTASWRSFTSTVGMSISTGHTS